jgi:hypothetical protein
MNAFLSYSVRANEQYIVSLLAQKAAESGLTLVTNYNQGAFLHPQTANEIRNAAVFIGLLTTSTVHGNNKVFTEYNHALTCNRPTILLVEDGISFGPNVPDGPNVVRFNRFNIEDAMSRVRNKMAHATPVNPDSTAWILGGIAALALLAYLSNDKK